MKFFPCNFKSFLCSWMPSCYISIAPNSRRFDFPMSFTCRTICRYWWTLGRKLLLPCKGNKDFLFLNYECIKLVIWSHTTLKVVRLCPPQTQLLVIRYLWAGVKPRHMSSWSPSLSCLLTQESQLMWKENTLSPLKPEMGAIYSSGATGINQDDTNEMEMFAISSPAGEA